MSRANIQPQQAERGSTSPERRKEQAVSIQIEIGRAFEVASAIEKAIRVESAEDLEQFLTRIMAKLFEQNEGANLRIGKANDLNELGDIQVHDNAPRKGLEWRTESIDYGPYPSGHPISLAVHVNSREGNERVCRIMEEHGFVPDRLDRTSSSGFVGSEWCDRAKLRHDRLAGLVCSLLKTLWQVHTKREILCWFDHNHGDGKCIDRRLESVNDLSDCLKDVPANSPNTLDFQFWDSSDKTLVFNVTRRSSGNIRLIAREAIWSDMPMKTRTEVRNFLAASGFVQDPGYIGDPSYPEDGWLGPEDVSLMTTAICRILKARGRDVKNGLIRRSWPLFCT